MKRSLALAFAVSTAALAAQAPTVTTVLANGTTQTRYDMVILGDGYQAHEQTKFDTDVLTFLTGLFQKQPYQTFAAYYNVHTVFRASVDSGADRPDENPPVYKNTVYDATYNYGGVDRCLYIQNTSQALADAALAPANEGRVLVMVNDTRYGGCAATFAVSYTGSQMVEVQTHELGHSLGQLADEYDYPYTTTYTGPEPAAVNITKSPTGQKWSIWHGTDGISAFQGAGYYQYGLYRPKNNCLMRALGVPLCRVCQENITRLTNAIVNTIISTSPATANVAVQVPAVQQFSFTHIVPPGNSPLIAWKLNGNVIPGATGTSYAFDSTTVPTGQHTLQCSVLDQTSLVRSDPTQTMLETFTWQVTVSNPAQAQLRIPTAAPGSPLAAPGGQVTITTTVVNDGPAAAGPFQVEFFLGTGPTWSVQDWYLGSFAVPGLAAAQQITVPHTAVLPWSLPPQAHYGFAVADRLNAVPESNENDNERLFAFFVLNGTCEPKLEFRDPLLYPHDAATVSIAAGGALHPRLTARCAPGGLYLLVWGGSGTTPGVPLAPGVTLPLNPDGFTDLGLGAVNGAVFGGFLGLLDGTGRAQATFALPAGAALPAVPTHFAGILFGAAELFAATTNPIALSLLP
jgi:hypothetical protein